MNYKLPKIIKCCCCIPLDYGLIISAYVKITIDLVFLSYILIMLVPLLHKTIHYPGADIIYDDLYRINFIFVVLAIDITMNIIFIVSSKLKKYKLMKKFYYYIKYSLAILILYFIKSTFCQFYFIGHYIFNSRKWREMIQETFFGIITIGLQFYFILMVKTKLLKIKRNEQLDSYKRRISEEECNTPQPGTSSDNNHKNSGEQIELKEIVSTPSEIVNDLKM